MATQTQVQQLDVLAKEKYGISELQMMELAGMRVAREIIRDDQKREDESVQDVIVLAGMGKNAADGFIAARHLHNWGLQVTVLLSTRNGLTESAQQQIGILEKQGCIIDEWEHIAQLPPADVIIDALLGYGGEGEPQSPMDAMIEAANVSSARTYAIDIPSGLDLETAEPFTSAIQAYKTVVLGIMKDAVRLNQAHRDEQKRCIHHLVVADIGIPREAYEEMDLPYPFSRN